MKHHHRQKVHLRNVDNATFFPSLVTSRSPCKAGARHTMVIYQSRKAKNKTLGNLSLAVYKQTQQ